METDGEEKPCLYCERPKSKDKEHVVQKGLGATVVLKKEVCEDCNSVFKVPDKQLIEYVKCIACPKHGDPDTKKISSMMRFHYRDERNDVWLNVRVENGGVRLFEQLIFASNGSILAYINGSEARLKEILGELETLTNEDLSERVRGWPRTSEPALMRSAKRKYAVLGATQAAVDEMRKKVLNRNAIKIEQCFVQTVETPHAIATFNYDEHLIQRATAKMALNFVCQAWEGDVAREKRFNNVRAFALHGSGKSPVKRVASDTSYLEDCEKEFLRPDHHSILLTNLAGRVVAVIFLYELPFALVILAETVDASNQPKLGLFKFGPAGKNRIESATLLDGLADRLSVWERASS